MNKRIAYWHDWNTFAITLAGGQHLTVERYQQYSQVALRKGLKEHPAPEYQFWPYT